MCFCNCCNSNNSVGPGEDGDAPDPISSGQQTISAGIANIAGSAFPADVCNQMEAAELLPFVQARPVWIAFCDVCLDLQNISFASVRTPQTAQAFWEAANGANGSASAIGSQGLQEAEAINVGFDRWFQQTTAACWKSLDEMVQKNSSLSTQQQAHLLLKLVDAQNARLLQDQKSNSDIYASGVRAALALVPSLVGVGDLEKYEQMAADVDILFWQGAVAVATSFFSPASP
jgi:hypothetical protein